MVWDFCTFWPGPKHAVLTRTELVFRKYFTLGTLFFGQLLHTKTKITHHIITFFLLMYVFLTPPALSGLYQVHEGAIGCLEQTNNLGNLAL